MSTHHLEQAQSPSWGMPGWPGWAMMQAVVTDLAALRHNDPQKEHHREILMKKPFKALICAVSMCFWLTAASAAIEVNQASSDDLESIKGIGPATAQRILQQRRTAHFRDWADFILRVPGIGEKRAMQLSEQGLRVQGNAFAPPPSGQPVPSRPIGYAPRSSMSRDPTAQAR